MSRWIDGEWILNFFEPYPDDYNTPLGTLRACVDDAPTIDAVSVVRCEECKWYNCNACFKDNGADNKRKADDYCSYGEREGE